MAGSFVTIINNTVMAIIAANITGIISTVMTRTTTIHDYSYYNYYYGLPPGRGESSAMRGEKLSMSFCERQEAIFNTSSYE